jgi:hypothetical protein
MSNNLPPGVSPGDPDAPWNQPDPLDEYFPAYCQECGERADSPEEMEKHRHARDSFTHEKPGHEPAKCSICGKYVDPGKTFCDGCSREQSRWAAEARDDYNPHTYRRDD